MSAATDTTDASAGKAAQPSMLATAMPLLLQLRKLAFLLFFVTTLLFFLLRLAGDPALVLAGNDASPEQLAAIRKQFGLDRPLFIQYFSYMWHVLQFDFGKSLASGEPALWKVLDMLKRTLHLAVMAVVFSASLAIPIGAWLDSLDNGDDSESVPGYVTALVLIQLLAVNWHLLPSLGYGPLEWKTWIIPTVSLAFFMAPNLIRVTAANVAEAMREDYIRTARANGAKPRELLWKHAVPNALLGTAALLGTQFAMLMGGSAIIETIFSWPGIGWLLLESVQTLDFPVVQAEAFVIAILVFTINALVDLSFRFLDPRLRSKGT